MQLILFGYLFIAQLFTSFPTVISEGDSSSQEVLQKSAKNKLIVISTTSNTFQDHFLRFSQSIQAFGLRLESLKDDSKGISSYQNGLSATDPKGEMRRQFELLQDKLSIYKHDKDVVLLLVEGANSIVNGNEQEILERFHKLSTLNGSQILFSADVTCWPEAALAEKYPPSSAANNATRGHANQRYLDSRSLIGYATALWDFIDLARNFKEQQDQALVIEKVDYDFQLYSTHVYLSQEHRERLRIGLDHQSTLFENLDTNHVLASNPTASLMSKVELEFVNPSQLESGKDADGQVNLRNLLYDTRPLVVYGSGSSAKIELNSLGNYLGRAWTPKGGCRLCNDSRISLAAIKDGDLPSVLLAVFIVEPTPFMEAFFDTVRGLEYPKDRIHLFVYNSVEYHEKHVSQFVASVGSKYASLELIDPKQSNGTSTVKSDGDGLEVGGSPSSEWQAREYALLKCKQISCGYLLSLDSTARLELPESLRILIETNRTIVAPLLSRPGKLWSNFWAAITNDGYYARSHDYVELVARERTGIWNVPLLMNAYLIDGKFLARSLEETERRRKLVVSTTNEIKNDSSKDRQNDKTSTEHNISKLAYYDARYPTIKPALIFARNLRAMNQFQFVTNELDFGHLVDPTDYNITLLYPDFYQLTQNKPDWEREYLHENYTDLFDERDEDESNYPNRIRLEQPCQDVYWFPLVSDKFSNQLIEMMEQFGQWSSGKNHDPRIEGGYESVPTRDIHFRQVGLHEMWLFFLREYIMPIQLKEYIGYEHDPPRTDLAFVVRYHPEEQPSLRPHHDSSTYTLNIALNSPGADYEGGGCRFVRYNCSVTESRKGWALIHPGRLTHYHEGLPVTKGTRYILVTFIDP